jgi:hypothetical protein
MHDFVAAAHWHVAATPTFCFSRFSLQKKKKKKSLIFFADPERAVQEEK